MADDIAQELQVALNAAYNKAITDTDDALDLSLPAPMKARLDALSARAENASAAFTNVVTALAVKAVRPAADIRYHQVQIQDQIANGAGFTFRPLSETVVYPWLQTQKFDGARSGWQTRTLERPKPYTLDYEENIQHVKAEFLGLYDDIEGQGHSAELALAYLFKLQIAKRETKTIDLAVPRTDDILAITGLFKSHFFSNYAGTRGASRLPVLALHAIYGELISQIRRFDGMSLRPLQEHSAADAQTGAAGDIEVEDKGAVFEAVEVKHNQRLTVDIAAAIQQKIMSGTVRRYYVLTTHQDCSVDSETQASLEKTSRLYDCQIVANGVLPTIRYYLRLLSDPSAVLPRYVELLKVDKAIAHEHRVRWNQITQG